MANVLITPVEVVKESLAILHTNNVFIKGIDKQYSKEFAVSGGKIGSTINVREPNRGTIRKGAVMQVTDTVETYVPLTLTTQWGTDVSFSTAELTLSLDDFSKRVLQPRIARLASQLDLDGMQGMVTGTFPAGTGLTPAIRPVYNVVGTPGTTPGTGGGSATGLAQYNAPIVYLNAGMMLDNFATPRDENRSCILNPSAHASSVSGLSGLFNPQKVVGDQYRKGVLGNALGFEFAMDQNVYALTLGTRAATGGTLYSAITDGSASIALNHSGTVVAGDKFTVEGVYSVNPETQQSTGQLQQFVITAAATLSGTQAVTVAPTPILTGSTVANGTVTTATGDFTGSSTGGAAASPIIFVGAASSVSPCNLAYHQDAFTFGTADLEMPGGVDFAARESFEGISMRVIRAYNIGSDQLPCRIDILGGFAALRRELACIIAG
jgi:hypothetical protein